MEREEIFMGILIYKINSIQSTFLFSFFIGFSSFSFFPFSSHHEKLLWGHSPSTFYFQILLYISVDNFQNSTIKEFFIQDYTNLPKLFLELSIQLLFWQNISFSKISGRKKSLYSFYFVFTNYQSSLIKHLIAINHLIFWKI